MNPVQKLKRQRSQRYWEAKELYRIANQSYPNDPLPPFGEAFLWPAHKILHAAEDRLRRQTIEAMRQILDNAAKGTPIRLESKRGALIATWEEKEIQNESNTETKEAAQ